MQDYKPRLEEIQAQIEKGLKVIDLPKLKVRKVELESKMNEQGFWDNPDKAAQVSQEDAQVAEEIEKWENIKRDVDELLGLLPSIKPEEDPETAEEFKEMVATLESQWGVLNIETFLGGRFDKKNAVVTLICGTGGKDAQDFTDMLLRMYSRYAESRDWKVEVLEVSEGDEVGLKQATVKVSGAYVYGYLKFEHGVHRLVRLSPFNSGNTRETSFAKVDVIPEVHFEDHIEIDDKDLKIDVYRASGAGGQHVNTTDSAVRITHVPTSIVVQCQNERSQHQNKEVAMQMLQGRLQTLMLEKQAETIDDLRGHKSEVSWGNQIRSYVLHPYKMVKDHRTDYEENNPDKVFDGDIHGFVERELEVLS